VCGIDDTASCTDRHLTTSTNHRQLLWIGDPNRFPAASSTSDHTRESHSA
jgi:hypothetical protein